jgi:hypothetical protein
MSKQTVRRTAPKRRPDARKGRAVVAARTARKRSDRTAWIIAAVVIAVGVSLVFVLADSPHSSGANVFFEGDKPASPALVSAATGLAPNVLTGVGAGSVRTLPAKLPPAASLVAADGTPRIVYLGAEYCPFCAAERWAMVQALSRFGTFKNLKTTDSAVTAPNGQPETDPDTATFSFRGATYTSPYIDFEPVEEDDNSYRPLETPTAEQAALSSRYDAPPYVSVSSKGAIPFIDFADQYMIAGASYEAAVLAGKTHAHIAAALSNPSSGISKGVVGTANVITATICKITGNRPAGVCREPAIAAIEPRLG